MAPDAKTSPSRERVQEALLRDAIPTPPPIPRPVEGLGRLARRANVWSTIAWNVFGPNRDRSVFVLGPPRTGTNWFARIMSAYFELPRYIPHEHRTPMLRPAVLHLHRFLVAPRRTVYLVRDPRDVAISYYHKIVNTGEPSLRARISRELGLPYEHDNLRPNLPQWVRLLYQSDVGGSMPFDQHVRKAREMGLYTIRYEDLLDHGEEVVAGAVGHLTGAPADRGRVWKALEETSFEKRTGRKRGEQDLGWASVRKGIAGDWVNHFDRESALAFQRCDQDSLVELGYERDDAWVRRFIDEPTGG